MTADSNLERRALEVMEEIMDLSDEAQTQALAELCQGNEPLKQRVEALLALDNDDTRGFEPRLHGGYPYATSVPQSVGPYRLLGRLGEGGMGAVYLAHRADGAYERQVAVKFVRTGNPAIAQQFAVERHILGDLKHPNIAQLLDGGEINGQPYLVMEYIEGLPINAYAAQPNIELDDVLRLFIQVATAVHYAHGRLIVHRDIKPGNVLVTQDQQAKLLDFGIAKLYQSTGAANSSMNSALTVAGLTPITPDYASPEQLAGEPATPASDIYALGILMYETLTGDRPYRLSGLSLPEAYRLLQETGELPPSQATVPHGQPANAQTIAPSFTTMQLQGDLDRIVMKAMHRDPARRYSSAAHVADDLERFLQGKPVQAHGDDWLYVSRKFVARHRGGVIATAMTILAIIAGLFVASALYVEAERARNQADLRFTQLRELAKSMMFNVYDEIDKIPGSTSARQMLVTDAQNYLEALSLSPNAPDDVKLDAAQGYTRLYEIFNRQAVTDKTERDKAKIAADKAQTLLSSIIAAQPESAAAYRALGDLLSGQADELLYTSSDPDQARAEIQRAIDAYSHAEQLQSDDLDLKAKRLHAQKILADSYKWQNEFPQAISLLTAELSEIEHLLNATPDHQTLMRVYADTWFLRGESHYWADELEHNETNLKEAEADYKQSLVWYQKLKSMTDETRSVDDALLIAYWSLGNLQYSTDKWQDSLSNYDAALALLQPQIARDPDDINAVRKVRIISATKSKALSQVGQVDAAVQLIMAGNSWFEQRAKKDPNTPVGLREVAMSYDTTADVLEIGGRNKDSCQWRQRALDTWQQVDAKWGIPEFDKLEPGRIKEKLAECGK